LSNGHIAGSLITAAAMIISAYIKGRFDGRCRNSKNCTNKDSEPDIVIVTDKEKMKKKTDDEAGS